MTDRESNVRLRLGRETIRQLDDAALGRAAAGAFTALNFCVPMTPPIHYTQQNNCAPDSVHVC